MTKKASTIAFLALLLVALPASASAQTSAPANSAEITRTLDDYVQGKSGIGVIAGVIDHGTVHVYTAGDLGAQGPKLDGSTEFQIASVTKTFTATLLAAMVLRGEIRLSDPIQRYLPRGIRAPMFHGRQITLLNLAEQNSGLPRLPANLQPRDPNDPYAGYTPAMLNAFLAHYTPTRAPGAQYEYSNLGVELLGELLANRAHTPFASLLQRRVLEPLGMTATGIVPTPAMLAHLAPGHDAQGNPAGVWHFELGAAGGLYSDMDDMLNYLQANLAAPSGPLGAAMAFAQRPRADGGFNGLMSIGLIWETNTRSGITWHNGEVGGYHAFIGFNRAQRSGVVLLTNFADMNADALALHILAPAQVPAPVRRVALPEDPAVTARIKALYASYISGDVDVSQMTPEFATLFTPAFVAQLHAGVQQLGPPQSWTFLTGVSQDGATRYDYRLSFASGSRVFSVWILPNGKIAGSRLSP